jgi:nicotinamidase-related amidase
VANIHSNSALIAADLVAALHHHVQVVTVQWIFPGNEMDTELNPALENVIENRNVVKFIKYNNNMMLSRPIQHYFSSLSASGVRKVILVGVALTSCVRESAIGLQNTIGQQANMEVVVDRYHCGGLRSRDIRICQLCMADYLAGTFTPAHGACTHAPKVSSPSMKAVADMKAVGIHVPLRYNWTSLMV